MNEHAHDWTADAVFIAHARMDIPRLIQEIRRLKHELAQTLNPDH